MRYNVYLNYSSGGTYNLFSPAFNLDGNPVTISVQGKGKIPQFSFSMITPLNFCEVTSPKFGEIHDADSDLVIEWTPEIGQDMKVKIMFFSNDVNDNASYTLVKESDDNGHFTVNTTTLKKMSEGILRITLQRGKKKNGFAPDGKEYSAYLYSQHELAIILQK